MIRLMSRTIVRTTSRATPRARRNGNDGWEPSISNFANPFAKNRVNALADHILVWRSAPGAKGQVWRPWRDQAAKSIGDALKAASDHFTVTQNVE